MTFLFFCERVETKKKKTKSKEKIIISIIL